MYIYTYIHTLKMLGYKMAVISSGFLPLAQDPLLLLCLLLLLALLYIHIYIYICIYIYIYIIGTCIISNNIAISIISSIHNNISTIMFIIIIVIARSLDRRCRGTWASTTPSPTTWRRHCPVLYCDILYCAVLYCTILYYTILYYTVLSYTITIPMLYYDIIYCTMTYTMLYYTMIYYVIL